MECLVEYLSELLEISLVEILEEFVDESLVDFSLTELLVGFLEKPLMEFLENSLVEFLKNLLDECTEQYLEKKSVEPCGIRGEILRGVTVRITGLIPKQILKNARDNFWSYSWSLIGTILKNPVAVCMFWNTSDVTSSILNGR